MPPRHTIRLEGSLRCPHGFSGLVEFATGKAAETGETVMKSNQTNAINQNPSSKADHPSVASAAPEIRPTDRLLLRPIEAAEMLGIGRSTMFAMIAKGEIPTVRFGRAVRVPLAQLKAWLSKRIEEAEPWDEIM